MNTAEVLPSPNPPGSIRRKQPTSYYQVKGSKKRIVINQGGTRSGKTYSILQALCEYCLFNRDSGSVISIVRKTRPALRGTAYRDFLEILQKEGWYSEEYHNKTEMNYVLFGNLVEFISVDEPQKIRGRKRNICFINEANELSWEDYFQLNIRTTDKVIIDYNPSDEFHWIYDKLVPDLKSDFFITTYRDNPFLDQSIIEEIERLQEADPNHWKVYGEGQRGTSSETIYTHWQTCKSLPLRGEVFYGQDFGYNVASALVRVEFWENRIYVQQLLYQTKLTTNDLIEKYKELDMSYTGEIYCDAAEPKTIEEMVRAGYNALPADKDVLEGIRKVKGMPLFITEDSIDLIKELKSYKWKKNKDEKILDEPIKFNDHACFTGGTLIETDRGSRRIFDINTGDYVKTSKGYKRVIQRFNNGEQQVHKYLMRFDTHDIILNCTPNHLIKTTLGWLPISKLQSGMICYLTNSLTTEDLNYTPDKNIFHRIHENSTLKYGNSIKGRFLRVITSIIGIKTHGTITSIIWNLKNHLNTAAIIAKRDINTIQNGLASFTKRGSRQQSYGINQMLGSNGTENTQLKIILEKYYPSQKLAPNAESLSLPKEAIHDSAIQTARLKHFEPGISWREEVYDLEVENQHEYFANGILVHNCDAMRYAVFTKLLRPAFDFDRYMALNN